MRQLIIDRSRFFEACPNPWDACPSDLHTAASHAKLGYADASWIESARTRSGARYLGWFFSTQYQRNVLVLNADGSLIK